MWTDERIAADIYITDQEAENVGGNLHRDPEEGKFKVELEVFHSLHCLVCLGESEATDGAVKNMIRKRVYGEQYPEMLTHNARIHVGKWL
jgi:hypothetical protein